MGAVLYTLLTGAWRSSAARKVDGMEARSCQSTVKDQSIERRTVGQTEREDADAQTVRQTEWKPDIDGM